MIGNVILLKVFIFFILISESVNGDHYIWGRKRQEVKSTISFTRDLELEDTLSVLPKPLILTPYIKQGWLKTARNEATVKPQVGSWLSYSGYFTVNQKCGSNIFFWFIPAKKDWHSAPVVVWLQGGPGSGSLYGLFEEIGPFNHYPEGLKERNYTWNSENNVIYIDQPVGSGYSFSEKNCFPVNMSTVTSELYSALTQFFDLFPELLKNKFFLTGESFAGHYIPALAAYIHKQNLVSKIKLNLTGILVANPLTKLTCHDYASFLFEWGVIGWDFHSKMVEQQKRLKIHVKAKQFREAWEVWDYILNDMVEDETSLTDRECMTGPIPDHSDYMTWVTTASVRRQLHVGDTPYNDQNWDVYKGLINTIAQPMTTELEEILEARKYSVGFFSGNLDLVCLTTSTECMLGGLQWWGAKEYLNSKREAFTVDGSSVAGWVKAAGPLYFVVVRDSGHSVPFYQPKVSLALITAATKAAPGVNPSSLLDKTVEPDLL